ncbi:zinc finger MYM-type protein 1-like [Photinus pyralis]|uniref:zinc finger MYM-type protein 1-like n=1 Tax=Photinus pyralis TaxID=7054 RepID=UPI0012670A16|nr:zinc finger MYM-type protein 1-like [Photinus pyralis]XP_031341634.1 zinc finger MYM-type protein 1-like [Photinus pyralis]XP_031359263.1 zinc finger MYM-type protein 1-like [Photinus pyralis]
MASEWHRGSSEKAGNFLSIMQNKTQSVELQINDHVKKLIEKNRTKLKSIISTVVFCATHNLPLRGKTDEHAIFNDLLHFREESGDAILEEHLRSAPKNAKYISHEVQNEIIDTCAAILRTDLVNNIKSNEIYSIMADESMDIAGIEQLSLGVRFYDKKDKVIKEEFLGFTPLHHGLDAETIANAITNTLTNWGLNLQYAVGQGYDGCSTMAGKITGVHKRISESFPMANFFHCASHRLNLVINDLNAVPQIRNTVATVKEVTKFFRENSQRRAVVGSLQKLCETRWSEKYKSIRKFHAKFVNIVEGLHLLSNEGNKDTKQKAFQLYSAVTSTVFIVCLEIVAKYSAQLEIVAQMLQGVEVDLMRVSKHIERLVEVLGADRQNDENEFTALMKNVAKTAEDLGLTLTTPRVTKKQCHRSNVPSSSGSMNIADYYRRSVFIPYLDSLIQALRERFSDRNQEAFELFNLHPKNMKALTRKEYEHSLEVILRSYGSLLDNFMTEGLLWYDLWTRDNASAESVNKICLVELLDHNHAFFLPNVSKAIQIAITLPPTTCTIERSFSTLRQVKTWIRSSMANSRLSGLCLMSVHRDLIQQSKDAFIEKSIDLFAMEQRRMQFLFK